MSAVAKLHPEVSSSFYGCGSPLPPALPGATVADLGCGTGFDVYVASQLVGPEGSVIGVDMTDEQLAVARKHQAWHAAAFGHPASNVSLRKGLMEDLAAAGVADASVDVVISNCVLNLCPDKAPVLAEAHRVLRPGGELYFGDVYADRRFPQELVDDEVFFGECISGALYAGDFRRLMRAAGFLAFWATTARPVEVAPKLRARMGDIRIVSSTVRAFKVKGLEDASEDYGQTATYKGGCPGVFSAPPAAATASAGAGSEGGASTDVFVWDLHTAFRVGVPTRVDGNTALALQQSRYSPFFDVSARGAHRGAFVPTASAAVAGVGGPTEGAPAATPATQVREVILFDVDACKAPTSKVSSKCCC